MNDDIAFNQKHLHDLKDLLGIYESHFSCQHKYITSRIMVKWEEVEENGEIVERSKGRVVVQCQHCGEERGRVFISAYTHNRAVILARQQRLPRVAWTYVPAVDYSRNPSYGSLLKTKRRREQILCGVRVETREDLIGEWYQDEVERLVLDTTS
jgi:hypothetical protein